MLQHDKPKQEATLLIMTYQNSESVSWSVKTLLIVNDNYKQLWGINT